jgi:hypothetical protein
MTQKWNLQDIKPAAARPNRANSGVKVEIVKPKFVDRATILNEEESDDGTESIKIHNGNKQKSKSLIVSLVVFFTVLAGGLFISALMGGAEVTVYPKHREPNVNAVFEAYKNAPGPDDLAYELMTLEAEGERQVKASGEEEVTQQAQGTILIYNEAQKEPLRLVTNTRFESENGLIFKIKDSVVVPGFSNDASGSKIAGVVTATVFADEVGDKYNLGPTKFTVPGFKGDPEYELIYAESTTGFTGGFNGKKFIIDEGELATAQQALRTELRDSLLARIDSEKPAGFTVFKESVTFTYQSLPSVAYGEDLATIKEKVLLRIPLFKEDAFASFVGAATIPGYNKEPVRIVDTKTLTFSYESATTSASDISNYEKISFNLSGRPMIVWKFDAEKLKADLLGANKTALNVVLGGYPSIEKATAVIRPFWKSTFPIDITEVKITEIISEEPS